MRLPQLRQILRHAPRTYSRCFSSRPADPKEFKGVHMQGGGKYGENAAYQKVFLELLKPGLVQAVAQRNGKRDPIVVDVACADGANSVGLYEAIRDVCSNTTFGMVDLPSNDWEKVRENIAIAFTSKDKILPPLNWSKDGVFTGDELLDLSVHGPWKTCLIQGNMHKRLLKDNSADIIICRYALLILFSNFVLLKHFISLNNVFKTFSTVATDN